MKKRLKKLFKTPFTVIKLRRRVNTLLLENECLKETLDKKLYRILNKAIYSELKIKELEDTNKMLVERLNGIRGK